MAEGTFGTTITCMDGRVQDPVSTWMKARFNVDYVDTITEPGPDRILAEGPPETVASIRRRTEISVNGHGSRVIVVVSHHDCAGNPVAKDAHLGQLARGVEEAASWHLPARIVGIWVNEQWQIEVLHDSAQA